MSEQTPRLELRGIAKRFGSVQALRGADFALAPGEVHALLGENGAGKTTLMRVAAGLERADGGTILVDGTPRPVRTAHDARRLGVAMVHQHSSAIPSLTVAENLALAADGWPVHPARLRARALELMERARLPLDPDTYAGRLSVSLKQRLEILKALAADARILLLDEPTAVLAPAEAAELLALVRAFTAERGGSVVIITHKLDEALAVAGRVTVLRHGAVTATGAAREFAAGDLVRAMLGEAMQPSARPPVRPPASSASSAPLVRAEALDLPRESGYGVALRQGSFVVRAGEIVGVAAVEGNGQRELLRAVAGLVHPLRGRLDVTGPVAFVPEDRTTEGLVPLMTLAENVTLGLGDAAAWVRAGRFGRVDWRAARRRTAELIARFGVRAPGPDAPAATLSGGNQQKLVVARALERAPRVLVAENPTRGLDVRAAAAVHAHLRAAAEGGAAVLVHSSDLDEVLVLATRVLVVAGGALHDPGPGAGRERVGELMLRGGAA